MNILFLLDHLGYAGGAWHGRTTYLVNVAPRLVAAGHHVAVCVLRGEHPAADRLRLAGVDVTCLGARRGSLLTVMSVAKRVRADGIDVLHATQRESSAVARALRPFVPHSAIVTHVVDTTPVPRLERLLNHVLPQPDASLGVSGAVRVTAMREYGVAAPRVRVLHNGVDLAALKPSGPDARARLRAEWGVPQDGVVVVSTSRLHPEKRLDVLIEMMPAILAESPRAVLVFAGLGEELDRYRGLVRSLGIDGSIRFLGHRNDIADVLAASDVSVMLCLEEAFGFAAVEALALGVPVVAYEAGGLAEIIVHGRSGLLAPPHDDAAFRSNLVRVLEDEELRARLSADAVVRARRFGVDSHTAALLRIYEESLRLHRGPRGRSAVPVP